MTPCPISRDWIQERRIDMADCSAFFTAALITTILFLSSGCQQIPRVEDHFNRSTPVETVRYFRYCVDAGELDLAYETLTTESRNSVTPLQFKALIRFVDVPELNSLGLRDLIVQSDVDTRPETVSGSTQNWWVTLILDTEDQYIEYSLKLVPGTASQWQVDLLSPRGIDLGGSDS